MYCVRFKWKSAFTTLRIIERNVSDLSNEYTKTPEYPPILDLSFDARYHRKREQWFDKIKYIKTVEEKLFEINVPKFYGWKALMLKEGEIHYNSLPFTKFITRTHMIQDETLPPFYSTLLVEEEVNNLVEKLKSQIEDVVLFESIHRRRKHEVFYRDESDLGPTPNELEDIIGNSIINQINRVLLSNLSLNMPHLLETQVDHKPRVEAFWFVGGIVPPESVRKQKTSIEWLKHMADRPVDRFMQYVGSPTLQLRSDKPLPPIVDLQESENPDYTKPHFDYDPCALGYYHDYRHGTNIPGFWPGDACEFGLISYHSQGHLLKRLELYGEEEALESLHVQAILASYGWLLPQACYQGFSTLTEMTYPLVTQTVITNGQQWSFYVYQMNTTKLHGDSAVDNPRCNFCWTVPTLKLFEGIQEGKLIGFNPDVLKLLVKLYCNLPVVRKGVEMKPYLGQETQHVADIEHEERREWLENSYKHITSNRPRHRLPYEIYSWEKIYKIDHNTRPMDKRRRPFEFPGNYPFRRRLDEHHPKYLPKNLRPETEKKVKWYKTFYP